MPRIELAHRLLVTACHAPDECRIGARLRGLAVPSRGCHFCICMWPRRGGRLDCGYRVRPQREAVCKFRAHYVRVPAAPTAAAAVAWHADRRTISPAS